MKCLRLDHGDAGLSQSVNGAEDVDGISLVEVVEEDVEGDEGPRAAHARAAVDDDGGDAGGGGEAAAEGPGELDEVGGVPRDAKVGPARELQLLHLANQELGTRTRPN